MRRVAPAVVLLAFSALGGCGSVDTGWPDDGAVEGADDTAPVDVPGSDADADVPVETEADAAADGDADVTDVPVDTPLDESDVDDVVEVADEGGVPLPCDSRFTVAPTDGWLTGEQGLVWFTDTAPHANFELSTTGGDSVTTAWLGVDHTPPSTWVWRWRVRGHEPGILGLGFHSDYTGSTVYRCQVRVDEGPHPGLACDARFGVRRAGAEVLVDFTDTFGYTNVELRASDDGGTLRVDTTGITESSPFTWSWEVTGHTSPGLLDLEFRADPSSTLRAACRTWI